MPFVSRRVAVPTGIVTLAATATATATATALALALAPRADAAPSAPAAAAKPAKPAACSTPWGIAGKTLNVSSELTTTLATGVRTGRHDCFDRVVVDLAGPVGGVIAAYPDKATAPNAIAVLSSTGLFPAKAAKGTVIKTPDLTTIKAVADLGVEKKVHGAAIITTRRLPFRVFVVPGPGRGNRLVIDVAHQG